MHVLGTAEDGEVAENAVVPPCPPASGFVMADNMAHRDAESGQWCPLIYIIIIVVVGTKPGWP